MPNPLMLKSWLAPGLIAAALYSAMEGRAQSFPSRPLELIVHTAPGGGSDHFARLFAETAAREKLLPQTVVVVNKPGGGGALALQYVSGKQGDPHAILSVASTSFLGAPLRSGLDIGLKRFQPLALLGFDLNCLVVRSDSPYKSLREFISAGKSTPSTINVAIGSVGGSEHYLVYHMEKSSGAKFRTVSFKSGNDAVIAVLGGHVQATTANLSEVMAQVESGRLRMLAIGSESRLPTAPKLPTFKEQGLNMHGGVGRGFAVPMGVPQSSAAVLEAAFEKYYNSAPWREFANRNVYELTYMNGADFTRYLADRDAELRQYFNDLGFLKK